MHFRNNGIVLASQNKGADPAQARKPERSPAPDAAVFQQLPDGRPRTGLDDSRRAGHRKRKNSGI